MKIESLSQFRVDYYNEDDTIEVSCNWLQDMLKNIDHYDKLVTELVEKHSLQLNRINTLEAAIEGYKVLSKNRRKLDITS